ncbi:MAG TPA: hypothetical protein VG713_05170 [Pirellulales bacterium]|nr:hypothetical protein [Pirellulales bacterium]
MHTFSRRILCSLVIAATATMLAGCAQSWRYSTGVDGERRPLLRPLLPWRRAQAKTFDEPMTSALPESMPFVASQSPRRGSLPRKNATAEAAAEATPSSETSSSAEPSVYLPNDDAK